MGVRGSRPSYGLFAANPPEGCTASWGGEGQNGRSYAEQVRYVRDERLLLSVRTVVPEPDASPVIGTVEDFGHAVGDFRNYRLGRFSMDEMRERVLALRREDAETAARPTTIVLDGVPVDGTQRDFPDCSVALFESSGLRVYCVATAELLAVLLLRSSSGQRVVTGG